eukprot:TRINITY_DN8698_c0_g1_i1.p1 TRINITY_DN8698_c0_g1~~TRINITY_DN8698_c0_g1_i1.p1  ORF type:complete len:669 (+),score=83.69 TRINITY_DN8698_c0_g1_i1:92-2008(+)
MSHLCCLLLLALVMSSSGQQSFPLHVKRVRPVSSQLLALGPQPVILDALPDLYYISVTVGTSGPSGSSQQFLVQLDTGSAALGIPGVGCLCSTTPDSFYDPTLSTTSVGVLATSGGCAGPSQQAPQYCGFYAAYGDGSSISGNLYSDVVRLTGTSYSTPSAVFGMILAETNNFLPAEVDGIFGIAYPALNCVPYSGFGSGCTSEVPVLDTIMASNGLQNIFALCVPVDDSTGVFSVGGPDPLYFSGNLIYVPILASASGLYEFYTIGLNDIQVGGISIGISAASYAAGEGSIVDSGTTLLLVSSAMYNALRSTFLTNFCYSNLAGICTAGDPLTETIFDGQCFPMSANDINNYPTLQFVIGGVTLSLPPQQYLRAFGCISGLYTVGIAPMDNGGNGPAVLLGDTFMSGFYTVFDRVQNRMGFATPQCSATCSALTQCSACTAEAQCGWCAATGTCMSGSQTPNAQCSNLDWYYDTCTPTVAVVNGMWAVTAGANTCSFGSTIGVGQTLQNVTVTVLNGGTLVNLTGTIDSGGHIVTRVATGTSWNATCALNYYSTTGVVTGSCTTGVTATPCSFAYSCSQGPCFAALPVPGSSIAAILIGASVGGVVLIAVIVGLMCCCRRRTYSERPNDRSLTQHML